MRSLRVVSSKLKHLYDASSNDFLRNKRYGAYVAQRNYGLSASYDSDGKTYGKIINKGQHEMLLIDSVMERGFRLINNLTVVGPAVIFPHAVLSWKVNSAADINEDSLSLFEVMEPKIDMLLIGYGDRSEYTKEAQLKIFKACRNLKLNFEVMTTENAASTFNFLSYDRRYVAAALIPPLHLCFFGMDDEVNRYKVLEADMDLQNDYALRRAKLPKPKLSEEEIRQSVVGEGR